MPSPDPISPADLRPGQRVRITMTATDGGWQTIVEGCVRKVFIFAVTIYGAGWFALAPEPGITQTIEVIE